MHHHDEHIEPSPTDRGEPDTSEEVLSAISAVESQLASLKRTAAERKERDAQLLQRETTLAAREAAFETRMEEVERDLKIIEQTRAALETERTQAQAERQASQAELEQAREAVSRRESDMGGRQRSIEEAAARLEALQAQAKERSGKLESRAQELEQAEARLTDQAHEIGRRLEAMEAQSRDLSERAAAAEERARQAEQELETSRARREQAEEAVGALEAALAEARRESSSISTSVEESESQIGTLTTRANELEERIERLSAERELRQAERDEALRVCERLERESAERLGMIEEKLAEAEDRASEADSNAEGYRRRADALEAAARALAEELEQARAGGGDDAGLRAQVAERDRAIAERDEAIAGLQSKLATATEKITQFGEFIKTQMPGGGGKAAAALESLQARVAELKGQVDALRLERDRLAARLVQRPQGPVSDERLQLRRERLSRMRKHLRVQGRKVRRANELLQDRFAQCESLLSRRAELAAVHQTILEQREKTKSQRSLSAASGAMLAFVVTAAVLLGLSWIAAEKVSPGEYAATAIIAADGGERVLAESAREEWQHYHEQMFEDPRFIESLADMLKRRGMATLGTPGAVQQALASGFTMSSPSDGQLHLEYRDNGTTRTERVLDTVAVAVARNANRTRSRRTDGAMSVVSSPAQVGSDPVGGDRLVYAAGIFGGGLCLSLTFGAVVWRRMATAKSTFEHDQQLQALLSEARWQDPRVDLDAEPQEAPPEPEESGRKKKRRKER